MGFVSMDALNVYKSVIMKKNLWVDSNVCINIRMKHEIPNDTHSSDELYLIKKLFG